MPHSLIMLDTNICSFIMRKQPPALLKRFEDEKQRGARLVVSAITYAEMQYGVIGKKASPKHAVIVSEFVARLDDILPWGQTAVDQTVLIKKHLQDLGTPIGPNDTAIAGHAIAADALLVTNNIKEFERVPNLSFEDWSMARH